MILYKITVASRVRLCLCVLQMVSLLMIGIAAWGKWFGLVSSFQVVGGVIGVGVFLFFVALAGLIGAMKHHQVLLFFVSFALLMLWLLSLLFVLQHGRFQILPPQKCQVVGLDQ